METTYLILLILAIIYVPLYIWVLKSPKAAEYGLAKYGPTIMVKTKLGIRLMDRLCVYRRFWKFFGTVSIAISFMLMAVMVYIMLVGILNLSASLSRPGVGVEYALAIPGINPLLPIWYGILGLVVAMVIHELAHGFQTRANGMRVDSTGLLHLVVPLGAFVNPNEEDVSKASRRAKLDLYSAGISINFIAAVVSFSIFAVLMLGGISSPYGDNSAVYSVSSDSPAYLSGIPSGAIIESIDGEPYYYETPAGGYSWEPGDYVTVVYITEDGKHTVSKDDPDVGKRIRWGVLVENEPSEGPAKGVLHKHDLLLSVSYTYTVAGASVTELTKFYGVQDFLKYMNTTEPGMTVTLNHMAKDGSVVTDTVELGSKGSVGYVGISTTTSGMAFITPNIMLDTARNPIYGADSARDTATSLIGYISGPFNGFTPMPDSVRWWYDVPMDGAFWIIVNVMYWIFWLNVMLGVSNAIPAFPFDGGFIFMGGLDALLERLGLKDGERRGKVSEKVSSYVSSVMLLLFVLVIAAAVF
ncbi:MAG: site-2 protease family protein [Candidatus Methanoplasma sp.]|nr:site-2 protease family protein [Candidatus Methanoplasma sp.]